MPNPLAWLRAFVGSRPVRVELWPETVAWIAAGRPACGHPDPVPVESGADVVARLCIDCGMQLSARLPCRHPQPVPVESGGLPVARLCLECGTQLPPQLALRAAA